MNSTDTKQQVGEVQGDARAQFEAWAKSAGLETKIYDHNDMYSHPVTRGAWMAWQQLAARQPGAQVPVAWQINATRTSRGWESCTRECYDDTLRTGRYMGLPAGTKDVEVRALYDDPPAQSIDLSRVQALIEKWEAIADKHGVRQFTGNDHRLFANELRVAIDQRDAAPGVE